MPSAVAEKVSRKDTVTEVVENEEEEDEEEEAEFTVEKILKHRTNKKGQKEYYLKWKGFPEEENTWEPPANLNCKDLVDAYEAKVAKEESEKKEKKSKPAAKTPNEKKPAPSTTVTAGTKRKTPSGSDEKQKTTATKENKSAKKPDKRNGFEKGLTAEEIIGAVENNGEAHFLIKWKGGENEFELVHSKIANVNIPQMVIAFYEARLTWSSTNSQNPEPDDSTNTNTTT